MFCSHGLTETGRRCLWCGEVVQPDIPDPVDDVSGEANADYEYLMGGRRYPDEAFDAARDERTGR